MDFPLAVDHASHTRSVVRKGKHMQPDHIEYRVSGGPLSGWKIFRQDAQIGVRHDLFDAVGLATHFAEREVALGMAMAKVILDGTLSVSGKQYSSHQYIQ